MQPTARTLATPPQAGLLVWLACWSPESWAGLHDKQQRVQQRRQTGLNGR